MQRRLFKGSFSLLGNFIPPWEKYGKSADDFFHGVLQHRNPILKEKKQRSKLEEMKDEMAVQNWVEKRQQEIRSSQVQETKAQSLLDDEEEKHWLPYGAKPEYFDPEGYAAWGVYEGQEHGDPYYANPLLQSDVHTLLPYPQDDATAKKGKDGWPFHGTAGLVIDIDGVFYRSKKVIIGSDTAIQQMTQLKIPFCFMTNGGGKTEGKKAEELSQLAGVKIHPSQIIQAHTPMSLLAQKYKNKNVLIAGPESCVEVAKSYGFDCPIGILEFQQQHPELVPLKQWTKQHPPSKERIAYPEIHAIFSFTDTMDALNDAQIIIDILTAPYGQIGPHISAHQTVPFYYSADDLFWSSEAPLPRLGGGGFREMLSSIFESVTGRPLQVIQYGKPRAVAYKFAWQRLKQVSKNVFGWDPDQLRAACMVGDNLETDIIGANAAGGPWMSVHVQSGVGRVPAAGRTLSLYDDEAVWLKENVSPTPHYVAPTLDHFVREMVNFTEEQLTFNKKANYGPPCPVNLEGVYGLKIAI